MGVALVLIYPCGKAWKNPPFPSRFIVADRSSPAARCRASGRHPGHRLPAIVSRPQSAWAPLVACPPQDGVSFATKPSGVDGVGFGDGVAGRFCKMPLVVGAGPGAESSGSGCGMGELRGSRIPVFSIEARSPTAR